MKHKEVKLAVNNLKISFRTANGKVQAVRDISFNLYKGETLAIVGESGSGKSVTSRAILGILAGNAIKEGGEIIYNGEDLMKIDEESFHAIRGDKIAMIFQDPLSSLNPIMKIGKQVTEAMLIKGKLNQKQSRKDFNSFLARLNANMDLARGAAEHKELALEHKKKCKDFDTFEYKHLELENKYDAAKRSCEEAIEEVDNLLFEIEKNAVTNLEAETKDVVTLANRSVETYVVNTRAEELKGITEKLSILSKMPVADKVKGYVVGFFKKDVKAEQKADYAEITTLLKQLKDILTEAAGYTMPNFFAMGYYLTFCTDPLPEMSVEELNKFLRKYLDDNFMLDFIDIAEQAVKYSAEQSFTYKKEAIEALKQGIAFYNGETFDKKAAYAQAKTLVAAVHKAIDKLYIIKDNLSYTFESSLKAALDLYFDGIHRNAKEEKRYNRQMASYNKKVEKGKTPDWKVAEKNLIDLVSVKENIISILTRLIEHYQETLEAASSIDYRERTVGCIDYLKEKASNVVYKVTKRMAKNRALKLLEEVGISEPRRRYNQYPFEFSGGMRQRIVIAIALSANPDILICDEPTTALDVTIQSQILELINKVKKERNLSVIFITHDLGVVANMANRVAVMYAGKIVEIGSVEDIFYSPAHPYTWALLSSMPDLDTKEKLEAIPGTPPNMIYPPKGDAFAERNKYAMQIDFEEQPPMFKISETHYAATWLLHPDAPKVEPPKVITDRIARMKKAQEENKNAAKK